MTTQETSIPKGQNDTPSSAADQASTSSEQVAAKSDKDIILDDLKQTMRDLGRIPRMIMAPVITYVASKREHIPEERRQHLQRIVHDIKDSGSDGIHHLKERFSSKHEDTPIAAAGATAAVGATTSDSVTSPQPSSKEKEKEKEKNTTSVDSTTAPKPSPASRPTPKNKITAPHSPSNKSQKVSKNPKAKQKVS